MNQVREAQEEEEIIGNNSSNLDRVGIDRRVRDLWFMLRREKSLLLLNASKNELKKKTIKKKMIMMLNMTMMMKM